MTEGDPRQWHLWRDGEAMWWFKSDPLAPWDGGPVSDLHPVVFLSEGKHHYHHETCAGCEIEPWSGEDCDEWLWCPTYPSEPTRRAEWLGGSLPDGFGRVLPPMIGNTASRRLGDGYVGGDLASLLPMGNNVGELWASPWLTGDLGLYCIYEGEGAVGDWIWTFDHCFDTTSSAPWSAEDWDGGFRSGCEAWSSAIGSMWKTTDIGDLDGDGHL